MWALPRVVILKHFRVGGRPLRHGEPIAYYFEALRSVRCMRARTRRQHIHFHNGRIPAPPASPLAEVRQQRRRRESHNMIFPSSSSPSSSSSPPSFATFPPLSPRSALQLSRYERIEEEEGESRSREGGREGGREPSHSCWFMARATASYPISRSPPPRSGLAKLHPRAIS